ncbi:hypothetical protein IE81DRAFT_349206 [Ceraceosorus guamensis]|uniref:Uncharacterized protein n=1 Tax=Ceraceosorus guamensis TaxID=1522189 RepID=A0A316VS46_9BASI|nr:hypothetical protein IE81DRAFT_349206 [Ceraceosorus guamensis]PWN40469.1 hypothetical protein IE81DRAFT_349206 [Ceraceosorus guamensis]
MKPCASKRHAGKQHAAALACPSGPKDIKHLLSLEESLKAAQQVCNRLQEREDVKATVNSRNFLQKFVKSATAHGKLCCSTIADQSRRVKAIGLQDGRSMAEEDGGGVYEGLFFDEEGEPTHRYTGMTTNFPCRYQEHIVACLYSLLVHYDAAREAEHLPLASVLNPSLSPHFAALVDAECSLVAVRDRLFPFPNPNMVPPEELDINARASGSGSA